MKFSLLTPEGELYSAEVEEVTAQGIEGELGILPDHIPLVTSLEVAPLNIVSSGQQTSFAVYGGMLQVAPDKITVLADNAELPTQIDKQAAMTRKDQIQSQIGRSHDAAEIESLKLELETIEVQIEVAS